MKPIALPWGNEDLPLRVPAEWQVVTHSDVCSPAPIQNLRAALYRGLQEPIGFSPLADVVDQDTTIALVMDDRGRPTPINRLAPLALDALIEAGAQSDNISGLFAIGTHRTMRPDEIAARAGTSVISQIPCCSFDCRDTSAFVHLGRTRRGTPVHINRIAVEADLRILLGTIEPHPQAGFGGGLKNLVPGLAAAETIGHNHLLMPSAERYNMIGTRPDENPMRLDLEEAANKIDGPTFVINVVLGPGLEPVAVLCGDAIAAHRAGVKVSREIYGVKMDHQVDVVVSSAYPMDQELRQAGKGILNIATACRPGGVIVGFMRCEGGLGNVALPRFPLPLVLARALARATGSRGLAFVARHIPGPAPEDRFLINLGLQLLKDYHVLIFSPHLLRTYEDHLPPVLYGDQDRLFERVNELLGTGTPKAAVFHQGSISFPIVAQPRS